MDKRDVVLALLDEEKALPYVPAAFFMHFGAAYRMGQTAIDRHLAYFRHTDMDFVKVQYEHEFPRIPEILRPTDWGKMPVYDAGFFAAPLEVVKGLVDAAKGEALVLMTLYSPFMCAGHATSDALVTAHLQEDPEAVKVGMEAITESLLNFVGACVDVGVDGFYASTQGGEAGRFVSDGSRIFEAYIKPYDLAVWEEIDAACQFSILHVCDYHRGYDDLTPFLDYPGQVVNASLDVGGETLTPRQMVACFGRPFMGGMERTGVVASGDQAQIGASVDEVLASAPDRFILGADCTVPGTTSWDDIRVAVDTAHAHTHAHAPQRPSER